MNPKTTIKQSLIHGKGLFATDTICAGELIGFIEGRETNSDGPYVLWQSDENDNYSQAIEVLCSLKYINHSKNPNVAYYDDGSVMAIKDITIDQELTHDYGTDWN